MAHILQKSLILGRQTFNVSQRFVMSQGVRGLNGLQNRAGFMRFAFLNFHQRPFFILNQRNMLFNDLSQMHLLHNNLVTPLSIREFSTKMRKVREKQISRRKVKLYKMKTCKAAQKRIRICGGIRNKMFKFQKPGYRHLNRNKSKRNLKTKRTKRYLMSRGDIKRAQKLLPYFKRKKYLKT